MSDDNTVLGGDEPTTPDEDTTTVLGAEPDNTDDGASDDGTPPVDGDDGKPADKPEDSDGDDGKDGAPETYEDFTVPEGVEIDEAAKTAFGEVAKDLNLTQEQAQKLVDYQSKRVLDSIEASQAEWNATLKGWEEAARQDPKIGGAAWDTTVSDARKFLDQFGTPELRAALEYTGVGNHPEFIRIFSTAGKAMSEDKFVTGNAQQTRPRNPADVLYPGQKET